MKQKKDTTYEVEAEKTQGKHMLIGKKISTFFLYLTLFIPFIVSSSTYFPFIVGKNVFFRVCAVGAGLGIAWLAWERNNKERGIHPPLAAMGIFVCTMLISALVGVSTEKSLWSNLERMEGWVTLAALFVYVVALVRTFTSHSDWMKFLTAHLIVTIIIGLSALMGMKAGERISWQFGNPAYLGVYSLFTVWISALVGFNAVRKLKEKTNNSVGEKDVVLNPKYVGLIAGIAGVIGLALMYFSQTRSVILGCAVGVVAALLVLVVRLNRSRVRTASIGLLALLALLGGTFWMMRSTEMVQQSPTLSRIANISMNDTTTRSRIILWQIGTNAWKERPVFGWGQDNFIYAFGKHYDPRMWDQEEWFDRAHNVFFDWLTQGGLVGLLAYLSIFTTVLWSVFSNKKNKVNEHNRSSVPVVEQALIAGLLISHLVNNFFVFDNITSYVVFSIVVAYASVRSGVRIFESRNVQERVIAAVILVLSVITLWSAWSGWVGGRGIIQALRSQQGNDLAETQRLYETTINRGGTARQEALEQFISSIPHVKANAPQLAPQYSASVQHEYEELINDDPTNARIRMFGVSLFDSLGNIERVEQEAKIASDLMPLKQSAQIMFSRVLMNNNKVDEARDIITSVLTVTPAHPAGRATAIALNSLKRDGVAEKMINEETNLNVLKDEFAQSQIAKAKRSDLTLRIAGRIIEFDPQNPQSYADASSIVFRSGNKAGARSIIINAQKLFPQYSTQFNSVLQQIDGGI